MRLPALQRRAVRLRAWSSEHPWRAAEVALALGLTALVLCLPIVHIVCYATLVSLSLGVVSFFRLLPVDAAGTLLTVLLLLIKIALMVAPAVRFWFHTEAHRRCWIALHAVLVFFCIPFLFAAITTPVMWTLLVVVSGIGLWCAGLKHPLPRVTVFLPLVLALEPTLSHSPLSDVRWTPSRLATRCAANDGRRPIGFEARLARSRYYAVTKLDDDLLLLSGERNLSRWLKRVPGTGRFRLEKRSAVRGNLWAGCTHGRSIWLTHRGAIYQVTRMPEGSPNHEKVTRFAVDAGGEPDFLSPVCDHRRGRVFVTEFTGGRLHELTLRTGAVRRRYLRPSIVVQMLHRSDGLFVGVDTARLFVYDPDRDHIVESHAAGIAVLGMALCGVDDAVAVADMGGRVRLFERRRKGRYGFVRGSWVNAPRRLAFSPDCTLLGVTSGDDQTVTVLRRKDLSVVKRYRVGPGLRDITFIGKRELVIADACTATFISVPE